tara:strand:+ start:911 stop:3787 length:2877 start_codon:yes stop_codon:yes gene_type:complete
MTSEDYRRLEAVFNRALATSGAEREAVIKAFEMSHPQLGGKLRQLLAADALPGDSLSSPVLNAVRALSDESIDPWIDRQIGIWKIVRRLGSGGMGAVFLVRRTDAQYEQELALKVMSAQLLDPGAVARFRAERQILANLHHPNIATLIDGGATDDDLPFLVMEHVDGVRIDAFCDARNLTLKERLRLFAKVCDGVDYAHRNLVVHRDLKPSNILVTDAGEPKLLDFGIAKLLEPGAHDITMARTSDGARMMTPEYASPEQVRGEQISVVTDVYALGVLLFRLLTGHSPYGPSVTTAREMESAILDVDPRPPSASVRSSAPDDARAGPSADDSDEKRAASTKQLRRSLAGDLDNIVLKCLQKDPERRYATVRELSADIDRYLTKRPVTARGDSWVYKAKKFLLRNGRPVAAAAMAVVTFVSLTAFYTVRLADERDKAQLAAAEAEQVASFLSATFSSASPAVKQGDTVTVLDLIGSAQGNIETLEGQDKLQGRLLFIMGESYYWLGRDDDAAALYQRSLDHLNVVRPRPVSDIIETLVALGDTQARQGDNDKAFETLASGSALARKELGPYSSKAIWFDTLIASNHLRLRQTHDAIPILEDAREKLSLSKDKDDELELFLLTDLATALDRAGRIDESIANSRYVIERSEAINGERHPNTIIRIYNFSLSLRRAWRLEDALEEMKIAIERGARTWEKDDPTRRSHLTGYAINLEMLGRFGEARALRDDVRDLALEHDGEESSAYLGGLMGVAVWNRDKGNLDTAAAQFKDVLDRSIAINGDAAFFTTLCRVFLAQTYNELGEYEQALDTSIQAMENRDVLSASLDTILRMQHAFALLVSKDPSGANAIVEELVAQRDEDGTQSGPRTVSIFTDFARFYRRVGALEISESYARRAHRSGQDALPQGNWYAALATAELAYVLDAQGKTHEARRYAEDAQADLIATFGPEDYRVTGLTNLLQK